jgi:hypothetical protein
MPYTRTKPLPTLCALSSGILIGLVPLVGAQEAKIDPAVLGMLDGAAYLSTDQGRKAASEIDHTLRLDHGSEALALQTTSANGLLFTVQVTNDEEQDVEPSIYSLTLASGQRRTTTTFLKRTRLPSGEYRFRNHFASTVDFANWTRGELPVPAEYQQSVDPLMDANIYANGVRPRRLYTVGLLTQRSPFQSPNSVGLWRSDDGGVTWSNPALVDSVLSGTQFYIDKPDVAVSWYTGTRGHVYVAYLRLNRLDQNGSQLLVRRSLDGGETFGPAALIATGRLQGVQLAVNSRNGSVYAVWSDFALNAIRFSSATASATTWAVPQTVSSGPLVSGSSPLLGGNVRALSLPMMRYNHVADRVTVVWHEFDGSLSNWTDAFYSSLTGSSWLPKRQIAADPFRDQFIPALDFDEAGNVLVTYYDRSRELFNRYYEVSWSYLDPDGNLLSFGNLGQFSDPNKYSNQFAGDYHDVWYWLFTDASGNRFHSAWAKQPANSAGELMVSGIQ